MTIERIGKFLIGPELGEHPSLGIESGQLAACVEEVREKKYRGVFASRVWGFREPDLEFLRECGPLAQVWLWDVALKDLGALHAQRDLSYLHFFAGPRRPPLDLRAFHKLGSLGLDWQPRDEGLQTLPPLKRFALWHFKPRSKSLVGQALPPRVTDEVDLYWLNVSTLEGLSGLQGVRRLRIVRCANLVSLVGLEQYADTLEELIVVTCNKLEVLPSPDAFPHLRTAVVNGKPLRTSSP